MIPCKDKFDKIISNMHLPMKEWHTFILAWMKCAGIKTASERIDELIN